jgi:hypothetical protein
MALIERISIARYARYRLCRNDKSLIGYPAEKIRYMTKNSLRYLIFESEERE